MRQQPRPWDACPRGPTYHRRVPASFLLTVPLGVILLIAGVAALVAGIRGKSGTLTRSSRLGIHGTAAESSEEAFTLANRVAAPVVIAAGGVLAVGAVLVVALRLSALATLVVFFIAMVGGIALLVSGGSLGENAATTVPKPATRPDAVGPAGCAGCACGAGGCAGLTKGTGLSNGTPDENAVTA